VANRQRHEVEGLIGFFVNTLALRVDLSDRLSVKDLLSQVKSVTLGGYANQDVPFEQVVELMQPERSLRYTPVFQAMFNFTQDDADGDLTLSGLSSDGIDLESDTMAKFDLTLSLLDTKNVSGDSENGNSIVGSLEYAQDLFNHETIERWAEYFGRLVSEFVGHLDARVPELQMLSETEHQHLLVELNQTYADYPDTTLIHSLFEERVKAAPGAIAVVFEDERLTYKELNQRANQLAHYLIEQGVKPDTLVGLCLDRSLEMVIGLLGILKAGGAYVPLDPSYPEARLAYQIEDANLTIIVTQEASRGVLTSQSLAANILDVSLDGENMTARLQRHSNRNPDSKKQGLHSKHLAYVIYTSGTTGNPKGVMIEHQALVNRIDWMQREYDLLPADKVLQKTPFTFDVSVWEFLWPLTHGSQLVVAKPNGHQDPNYLVDIIIRQEINVLHFVPSMLNAILPSLSRNECLSLRKVFSSGEALSKNIQDQFFTATKDCELHNLYGPTEAAIDVSYWVCDPDSIYDFVPIGKPIQNCQFYIVNEELTLCPQGVTGELLIGGVGLARGYLNQTELTSEKFIANPFYDNNDRNGSERLYKTGDLVRWLSNGNVEYLGRTDHQVKLRGFRIELGEIESLLKDQAVVRDAVVMLDDSGHEGQLVAYVVTSDGFELDSESLRRALSVSLPEYMVPAIYIELEALPLTSNGKVDHKALPKPESEHLAHAEYEAPQGGTERVLAEIWQDLLNVERVSRHDNFFRSGGHSLLAIRHVNIIKSKLNFHMSLNLLFDANDLRQLAKYIDTLSVSDDDSRDEIEF
jgi:amino acid adenylation domain-containing protein